jgi:hypothetical protein
LRSAGEQILVASFISETYARVSAHSAAMGNAGCKTERGCSNNCGNKVALVYADDDKPDFQEDKSGNDEESINMDGLWSRQASDQSQEWDKRPGPAIPQKSAFKSHALKAPPPPPTSSQARALLTDTEGIFDVPLKREGSHYKTLGLAVSPDDNPMYLVVDKITEPSLIAEWNKLHDRYERVLPGMMILAVNDIQYDLDSMLHELRVDTNGKGSTITLTVGGCPSRDCSDTTHTTATRAGSKSSVGSKASKGSLGSKNSKASKGSKPGKPNKGDKKSLSAPSKGKRDKRMVGFKGA